MKDEESQNDFPKVIRPLTTATGLRPVRPQINPEGPLATAWEVADIAIRLAHLKGRDTPGVGEAARLLDEAASYAPTIRVNTYFAEMKNSTPEAMAENIRNKLPASVVGQVKAPESFPVSLDDALRLISQAAPDRRREFFQRYWRHLFIRAFQKEPESPEELRAYGEEFLVTRFDDEGAFWIFVEDFAPAVPKFQKAFGERAIKAPRKKRARSRDAKGSFKKKKESS